MTNRIPDRDFASAYSASMYSFFKGQRSWYLLGQSAQSSFLFLVAWNLAPPGLLIVFWSIHQLLVATSLAIYYSNWTNARITRDGTPIGVREISVLTLVFAGSILWMVPEVSQMLALSVSIVYYACAAGTVVLMGPLKNFARLTLSCFMLPHGLACLAAGHFVMGSMVLVFLGIVALGGINVMGQSFVELVEMREQSRRDAVRLAQALKQHERIELERHQLQNELQQASRLAGKAEIATGVLHNVGNVMNSVNVAASVIQTSLREDIEERMEACIQLLAEQEDDLPGFFSSDPRACHLVPFLRNLHSVHREVQNEVKDLIKKVDHVNQVVAAQQSFAFVGGLNEVAQVNEVVDEAIRITEERLQRHQIHLQTRFETIPEAVVDRQRLIQILVNLINNARNAIEDSAATERQITLATFVDESRACIAVEVADTGVGIASQDLGKIFQFGFSNRKQKGGHGFGLHHSVNSAAEVNWNLSARSAGRDLGATFRLEIPLTHPERTAGIDPGNPNCKWPSRTNSARLQRYPRSSIKYVATCICLRFFSPTCGEKQGGRGESSSSATLECHLHTSLEMCFNIYLDQGINAMGGLMRAATNVAGRLMLAMIFLTSAIGKKIPDFAGTVEYMTANGVPLPGIMLVGAILFLLLGSASIVLGYRARIGAGLLITFLVLATYFFHDFWSYAPDSEEFQLQMIQFMKNLGLAGGLLLILANGSGAGSLDKNRTTQSPAINEKHGSIK